MLEVDRLSFERPGGLAFHYDFTLAAGEILAVQGPSGVGKTTLLDLIAGFESHLTGRLAWDGIEFSTLPPWERPVTTVFQSDNLFAHLSCRENVTIALDGATIAATEVDGAFARLDIDGLQARLPEEISGGQQQRVALVRALLRDRPILLLDESFSALDWPTRRGCFDALQEIATTRRMAVIFVSHDERDAAYLECDVLKLDR
ncbi:MAG: ATP-binding cassette domain-containing protein [Alphaproteobacteria bacterium]|nr:ATP-binding cassette domain-containing protein [Alphaproteobacteria bacterium]